MKKWIESSIDRAIKAGLDIDYPRKKDGTRDRRHKSYIIKVTEEELRLWREAQKEKKIDVISFLIKLKGGSSV